MPESDISKMKTVDLKREMKLRELPVAGNKTELLECIQSAVPYSDLSLPDTAISGGDVLVEKLSDEKEKALCTPLPDKNVLLKLPTSELNPELPTERSDAVHREADEQPKKIVRKRKILISTLSTELTVPTTAVKADLPNIAENEGVSLDNEPKKLKLDDKPKQIPDKNVLLKLPTSELNPELPTERSDAVHREADEQPKKIVRKRKILISTLSTELTVPTTAVKADLPNIAENEGVSLDNEPKKLKLDDKPKQIPDKNVLLKLPTSELNPELPTERSDAVHREADEQPKKIVRKRKILISTLSTELTVPTTAVKADLPNIAENEGDSLDNEPKKLKLDDKPKQIIKVTLTVAQTDLADVSANGSGSSDHEVNRLKLDEKPKHVIRFSAVTLEERLQLRAKKFGLEENKFSGSKMNSIAAGASAKDVDPKQIETLKKRAERFGCVVSSTIAKIAADERLEKRKQRFRDQLTTPIVCKDIYAEKARLRLERFKTAAK